MKKTDAFYTKAGTNMHTPTWYGFLNGLFSVNNTGVLDDAFFHALQLFLFVNCLNDKRKLLPLRSEPSCHYYLFPGDRDLLQ